VKMKLVSNVSDNFSAIIIRSWCSNHIVTCIHIAKQRLGKQTSITESVFYGVRTATVAMQWFGKHVSTIETAFPACSVPRSYLEDSRRYKEFRVQLWKRKNLHC
jgi:hypothetical protein